jgi:tetratricopeptide (TPR) repeat protein
MLKMNDERLNRVLELIHDEKPKEAQLIFNDIVPEESIEYLMVKGKLEQKFQNWGKAINAFSKVTELDPENIEAQNRLHVIQNILNFWNPEMFNP